MSQAEPIGTGEAEHRECKHTVNAVGQDTSDHVHPAIEGPKPISIDVSTHDIQALFAMNTNPDTYNQLLLAKLKDAGGPVEGALRLRLAHGQLFKLKDSIFEEQTSFTYVWLPEAYVDAIANGVAQA
jgi:hypothetical protein